MCIVSISSIAQDSIRIHGSLLHNSRFAKVVIKQFNIGNIDIAAFPIKDEHFKITTPATIAPGVYRLQYSQAANEYVDIIVEGNKEKEIEFSIDLNQPIENRKPLFTASEQNKIWYDYQAEQEVQLQKITALQNALALYPDGKDKIIKLLQKAIVQEQNNYRTTFQKFTKDNSGSWAANMVANKPVYFTNPKLDWRVQNFEKRNHFWDGINTTQPELINTPLYTELILEYLKYYMNPEMSFSEEEMNAGFIKSVDIIMERFGGNSITQEFALRYLQLGFKEIGNEKVLQYIDEKYKDIASQCQDEVEKADFEKRMASYAAIKTGTMAPDIILSNQTSLYDINSDKTLLVFWASWCPHCMEEMPKLNEWAKNNANYKVIAISLDDDQEAYTSTIQQLSNLIHSSDFKKWEGKAVMDYFIHATPTFILLDKDKKIIDKYSSFDAITK